MVTMKHAEQLELLLDGSEDEAERGFMARLIYLAKAVTVPPICQEELFNPGLDVSINPNYNPILTPQRPVPDVRLGYASTGHLQSRRFSLAYDFFRFVR